MRQTIIKLCALIALLSVMSTVLIIPASAAATPTISASSVKAEAGTTVDVAISLASNPGLWSIGLYIGYDHSALTLKGYTAGSVFTAGEITPPPTLDKETYLLSATKAAIADTKVTGKLVTLTFLVAAKATYKDYPITLELKSGDNINAKSEDVALTTSNGKVTVVNCIHKNTTWTTVTAATCLKSGSEKQVCNKCKLVLNTRVVAALGHLFTNKVISDKTKRSDATASKKATYFYTCERCSVISSTLFFSTGEVTAYKVTEGADGEWTADNDTGLTFTADGDFKKFTSVKIDESLIDSGNYEAKSGSTIVTLNVDYLKSLEAGDHKITIVYTDGEISAAFKIAEATITENTTATPVNNETTKKIANATGGSITIYIIIAALVLLFATAAIIFFKKMRR